MRRFPESLDRKDWEESVTEGRAGRRRKGFPELPPKVRRR